MPDSATTAWVNAVVTAGGTVSAGRQTVVDNLITGLKSDGIWTKLDRLWIFAAENTQSALIDLVSLSTGTPTNSPTFTANAGYTCTAVVALGYVPSTNGVQFKLNTAHISVWSLTSGQSNQPSVNIGNTNIFPRYIDDNAYFRINNNSGGTGANTDGSGFFLAVRTAPSGAGAMLGYRNGAVIANTGDGTSVLDTTQLQAYDRQLSAISVGGTMNGTDAANYYSRLNTYMTSLGAQTYQISAPLVGGGNFQSNLIARMATKSTWSGVGSIPFNTVLTQVSVPHTYSISSPLAGAGALAARLIASPRISAALAGAGAGSFFIGAGRYLNIGNVFSEGLIDPDTGLPYGTLHGRGRMSVTFGRLMGISAQLAGEGACAVTTTWLQADFIWPGIVEDAGEQLLYRQAAGLEKSLATVDAYRLTQTYAELIRDQWDPYRISSINLPYLAWAMGVNLWENTWSEEFKRYWVANQWTMKYERGSAKGLNDFVNTVNASPGMHAQIVNLVVPPACFYPGNALTDAERQAYVARFPQLRLYPYAPRPQLPYLGYLGGFSLDKNGQKIFVKNGRFLGPLLKYYPTNYNAGGDYLRSATLYEPQTGVETQLTVRTVVAAPQPGQKEITYDEISLSSISGNLFYPGRNKQYLLSKHPTTQKLKHAVVLGRLPYTASRLVRVPRDGTLDRTQYQALFTTINPGLDPINVRPEQVYQQHPVRQLEWYCGMPLRRTYLTKSNAWQFLYERWYLFDPTRLPDNRKASTYMGRARFGIHKYTAEADIQAWFTWPKFYARANGYYGKGRFFPPKNTKLIDQIRRAVTASMAARDTVQIDTGIKRVIQIRDLTVLDGRFSIGQYVTDRTA